MRGGQCLLREPSRVGIEAKKHHTGRQLRLLFGYDFRVIALFFIPDVEALIFPARPSLRFLSPLDRFKGFRARLARDFDIGDWPAADCTVYVPFTHLEFTWKSQIEFRAKSLVNSFNLSAAWINDFRQGLCGT